MHSAEQPRRSKTHKLSAEPLGLPDIKTDQSGIEIHLILLDVAQLFRAPV
jgi:hypothetical protein